MMNCIKFRAVSFPFGFLPVIVLVYAFFIGIVGITDEMKTILVNGCSTKEEGIKLTVINPRWRCSMHGDRTEDVHKHYDTCNEISGSQPCQDGCQPCQDGCQPEKFSLHLRTTKASNLTTALLKSTSTPSTVQSVTVWPVMDTEDRWLRCCEGTCHCRPETVTLSCWRQELGELPIDQVVPKDVRVIDLGINFLTTLHRDTFQGLNLLTELDLFDNQIDYLPEPIFYSLNSLQHLRLHKNRLLGIPQRLFMKLINLETLDLSMNKIQHIPGELFQGIKKLAVIHLSGNSLKDLPEHIFKDLVHLEELDLSNNVLTGIQTGVFRGLNSLKRLRLQDNLIQQLPEEVLSDLEALEQLSLRKNCLSNISPKLFSRLTHLKHLDLSNNWISSDDDINYINFSHLQLDGQEFSNLSELEELHLSQNYLEKLPDGLFLHTIMLKKLFLFSNNLEYLGSNTLEGLDNLSALLINNNLLRSFSGSTFSHVSNLLKLHMDNNKLQFIPAGSLDFVPKLITLKLGKNPWHCDCSILYLATWLHENKHKVWDSKPTCRGSADHSGQHIEDMTFDDLCAGQWASMAKLTPRLPIK